MATATLDKGTRILDPEALDFEVILIDPAFEIPDLIKSYREEQNLGEALEQVEPIIYAPEELSEVSWLVGKTYSACRVYELDGFYNRPVAPYFCAESGGGVYATEEMGLGEASLHYIFWALKRAQKKSLILIEEPETFISARSQSALMDLLAKTCLVKDCTAIVTTHSPQVFSKVPPKDTLIMVQSNGVPKVIVKDTSPARLAALSVPPVNEKAGYLLVEDRMAREFTRYWMRFACPELLGHWRVIDLGSAGHVVALLKIFPIMGDKWFRAVGVLDGDERDKNWTSKAPISYLPTNDPPEVYLRTTILANAGGIAADLNLDPEEFQISLAALDGMDHHDWFMELANAFAMKGLTFEKLVACAVETWIAANEEISAMAAEELRVATQ
ncbi:MAG TPA: AAA family ATPase [Verrucomicrobiales bacterium]|nr:AAA family ATPase [Verrucomicrobiales bacterium]